MVNILRTRLLEERRDTYLEHVRLEHYRDITLQSHEEAIFSQPFEFLLCELQLPFGEDWQREFPQSTHTYIDGTHLESTSI